MTLTKPNKILYSSDCNPLNVLGQFVQTLTCNRTSSEQPIFLVKGDHPARSTHHYGVKTGNHSQLHQRLLCCNYDSLSRFSLVWGIWALFFCKCKALCTPNPKQCSLPTSQVKQELEHMESIGIISRVNEPSQWCVRMVAVQKKIRSTHVWIWNLLIGVSREKHPLPNVDDILAQLSGATVFSKLDAKSWFWQIPLTPSSCLLTTIITPFSRYHFNKLPFGIASAPEHFQKRLGKMLPGLEYAYWMTSLFLDEMMWNMITDWGLSFTE